MNTEYFYNKTVVRGRRQITITNRFIVYAAARELPLSTLTFLLENQVESYCAENEQAAGQVGFTLKDKSFCIELWYYQYDNTWSIKIRARKYKHNLRDVNINEVSRWLPLWQDTAKRKAYIREQGGNYI
jgi:hypothetical protein